MKKKNRDKIIARNSLLGCMIILLPIFFIGSINFHTGEAEYYNINNELKEFTEFGEPNQFNPVSNISHNYLYYMEYEEPTTWGNRHSERMLEGNIFPYINKYPEYTFDENKETVYEMYFWFWAETFYNTTDMYLNLSYIPNTLHFEYIFSSLSLSYHVYKSEVNNYIVNSISPSLYFRSQYVSHYASEYGDFYNISLKFDTTPIWYLSKGIPSEIVYIYLNMENIEGVWDGEYFFKIDFNVKGYDGFSNTAFTNVMFITGSLYIVVGLMMFPQINIKKFRW